VIFYAHPSLPSNRHLDPFSRFTGLTNVTNRQSDRQTDRPRYYTVRL